MSEIDEFTKNYAPYFCGMSFAVLLYGVTCAQVSYYFWNFTEDQYRMKCTVALLWFMDTLTAISNIMLAWWYLIFLPDASYYLAQEAEPTVIAVWALDFATCAVIVVFVQGFYIHSIWISTRGTSYRILLVLVLSATAACAFAAALAMLILGPAQRTIPGYGDLYTGRSYDYEIAPVLQMGLTLVTDICITISLCISLGRASEHTHSKQTGTIVRKINQYLIGRGVLTAVMQILQLLTYLSYKYPFMQQGYPFMWIAFQFIGSKIYVNSLLSLLNARSHLREAERGWSDPERIKLTPIHAPIGLDDEHVTV